MILWTSRFLLCVFMGCSFEDSSQSDSLFGGEVVGEVGSRLFDHHHRTGRPLESGCFSPKAFVVWVEGVVGIAVLLSLGIRRYCVGGKSGHWSSRAIEDGSVVPVVAVGQIGIVVVVGAGGGWSSNKGCHRHIEGVSGCVARELVGPRILNLILTGCYVDWRVANLLWFINCPGFHLTLCPSRGL